MSTCCFTGHREIPAALIPDLTARLDACLRRLIAEGCTCFRAGGAMGFDRLASERVLALREEFPAIRLELILPCHGQDNGWPPEERAAYRNLLARANRVVYLAEHYTEGCMQRRNLQLLAPSDICVAYQHHLAGGTAFTVANARRRGIEVINLAEAQ